MRNLRTVLLLVATALLAGILAWRWVSEWGLVTLNYSNAPLSNVIKSIERQGRVEIRTNADQATPVTIRLNRAPVFEAIDTLGARIDADARLAYLGAPSQKQIADVLAAFSADSNPGGWRVFSPGFSGGMIVGDLASLDPRVIEWKVTETGDRRLQALLDQGAQKTGAIFAVPEIWNPELGKLPSVGKVREVTTDLMRTVSGKVQEVFLLMVRPLRREDERMLTESGEMRRGETVFSPQREGKRNPQWAAERVRASIAMLPKDEQAAAQMNFDELRAFWESIRDLPEQERRARIEEQSNRPEDQAQLDERAAARYERRSSQQREQWYRNYIQRKEQIKGAPAKS
jgi:hypothetical protein